MKDGEEQNSILLKVAKQDYHGKSRCLYVRIRGQIALMSLLKLMTRLQSLRAVKRLVVAQGIIVRL